MRLSCLALILVIGVALGSGSQWENVETNKINAPYDNIRLPGNIIPLKYRIYLHPNITDGKFQFTGDVQILLEVKEPTDRIVLHSKSLTHLYTKLYEKENEDIEISVTHTQQHEKHEMVEMALDSTLSVKKRYVLHIIYSGKLSGGMSGFYKSSYKTKKGKTRFLATTQFESTGARLAFPCFDEPAMKASFMIIMVREKTYTALSNMPVEKEVQRSDGLVEDHFQESVKMSTYLVAFVVSDFTSMTASSKRGVKIKVWAPTDQISQAQYAIEVAPKILDYYEEFFNVNFPLPKQDLVAIPDFAAGAMENWGLITYRSTALLYDEKESSTGNKQRVAIVIAHELAHQWFGNLVTMTWWNDLWLNEGFASYVEYIGTDYLNKDWHMMEQMIISSVQSSFALDSHINSHPISVSVNDPAEIGALFDAISYNKGSSIIRMMRDFIGADSFTKGLSRYLNTYTYGNAVSEDLWACLSLETKPVINVKSIMDTWTLQMGYPVINVVRDTDNHQAVFTQKRFITDVNITNEAKPSPFNYKWEIPLTFYFQHETEKKREWFHRNDASVKIAWENNFGWLKINADQIGFYRVNYDTDNWMKLAKQLADDHKVFSAADRSNLIDDAFALAKSYKISQIQALDLTAYLRKEEEYIPFISALSSLGYIGQMLIFRDGYKTYENYILSQILPRVNALGWKDEGTHLNKFLRGIVLEVAVFHNHKPTVEIARKMFDNWMRNGESIPPNLRTMTYLAGIKYGGKEEWDFMYKRYQESSAYPSEHSKLMISLTETSEPKIIEDYLEKTLNMDVIRAQDTCKVIGAIAANPKGKKLAYNFVIKNWDILFIRYRNEMSSLPRLIKSIFAGGKTKEELQKAEDFMLGRDLGTGKLAGTQALAYIRNHIYWLKYNEEGVVNWFQKNTAEY